MENNYFTKLNSIDVNDKVEKKNGLTYLSWAFAWGEAKKEDPNCNYVIYENKDGWNYFTDGRTAWVKVGVTMHGIEHIETLPVMDYRNQSIPCDKLTSFNVNTAIQRCLTKAIARHGLGLYIYAGEDLPEDAENEKPNTSTKKSEVKEQPKEEEKPSQNANTNDLATFEQLTIIKSCEDQSKIQAFLDYYKLTSISQLTMKQASVIIGRLREKGYVA